MTHASQGRCPGLSRRGAVLARLRETLRRLAPVLHPGVPILSLVKGIEEHTHTA